MLYYSSYELETRYDDTMIILLTLAKNSKPRPFPVLAWWVHILPAHNIRSQIWYSKSTISQHCLGVLCTLDFYRHYWQYCS